MSVESNWENLITERERLYPFLRLLRSSDIFVPQLQFKIINNHFDKMTNQLPEWEIYTTPKERVKILLDTFGTTQFNVLLANYLWVYDKPHCDNQLVALTDFHKLPDMEEIYKYFKYWKEKNDTT